MITSLSPAQGVEVTYVEGKKKRGGHTNGEAGGAREHTLGRAGGVREHTWRGRGGAEAHTLMGMRAAKGTHLEGQEGQVGHTHTLSLSPYYSHSCHIFFSFSFILRFLLSSINIFSFSYTVVSSSSSPCFPISFH